MKRPKAWIRRPEILDYIVESYAGTERSGARKRRVFLWEEGPEIKMGNTEAFVLHLARRFDLLPDPGRASQVHKLLRDLGEQVSEYPSERAKPEGKGGKFKQPTPEDWTIGRKKDAE